MRLSILLLICTFVFNAAGCRLLQLKGEVGGVEVEATTKDEAAKNKEGDFCPPGQAKKGKC